MRSEIPVSFFGKRKRIDQLASINGVIWQEALQKSRVTPNGSHIDGGAFDGTPIPGDGCVFRQSRAMRRPVIGQMLPNPLMGFGRTLAFTRFDSILDGGTGFHHLLRSDNLPSWFSIFVSQIAENNWKNCGDFIGTDRS